MLQICLLQIQYLNLSNFNQIFGAPNFHWPNILATNFREFHWQNFEFFASFTDKILNFFASFTDNFIHNGYI